MIFVGDPRPRVARRQAELKRCFDQFLDEGRYVLGPGVSSFEQAFSRYTGISHTIGVANGTDAIELALRSVGVGAGDPVLTVANAGGYSTTALAAIGAVPLYVDVDSDSCCITLDAVVQSLPSRPKAVIATHLYGRVVPEISAIAELCRHQQIPLIEDCAQAHGARLAGRHAGGFGDVSCFSFYPTKNLGGLGDGGAVCTDQSAVAERCRQLRQYGWTSKYHVGQAGGRNSRLDELQARFLELFLDDLDQENQLRREIAVRYRQQLSHSEVLLPVQPADPQSHVYHLFVVQVVRGRDQLRAHLAQSGIQVDIHYPVPDHLQAVACCEAPVHCPVTEALASRLLTLPCYPYLRDDQLDHVINTVNDWSP